MSRLCEGRVAIVTGAARGIGREYALQLAACGAKVVVNDLGVSREGLGRDTSAAQLVVDEIKAAGGEAIANCDDVSEWKEAEHMIHSTVEHFGKLDVVINNAGIFPFGPTHEMSEQSFDDVYALNVKASYFLVAELAPSMAQRGKGAIVNVSTMVADYGAAGVC